MKTLKKHIVLFVLAFTVGASITEWALGLEDPKPPVLTPQQRETIRKFQLDDARASDAIKQRQLEIAQIQQQQQANAKRFMDYVAQVCGEKAQFDMGSDELRCVPRPTPAATPSPTPTPEKKK